MFWTKRSQITLIRYKDQLQQFNFQFTIIPPKLSLISVEYKDVIVIYITK